MINFEVPTSKEEYVHRIGRTGRAEKEGVSITFANDFEMIHLKRIRKALGSDIAEQYIPETVVLEPTPKEERLFFERKIDYLKQKEDPNYKGAFHEKKGRLKKEGNKKDEVTVK